ncbi:hypothetical protein [Suttonella ornithocola]|uniref:Uncharacterized protein n=1 Tax=Suttonella ornithocola TaxID=279832 RepID=A0A380N091_9GAMM|nr:hypothetical protein [Suttonella ornithocola]SUO97543.1 Uncharacterised protein [Suttonella ornithocola]
MVNICNLALARLGDSATVASIDPPEGSAKTNSLMQAFGYDTQAINALNQADALTAQASTMFGQKHGAEMIDTDYYHVSSPYISSHNSRMYSPLGAAATSLIGSAGDVMSAWYQYKKSGVK